MKIDRCQSDKKQNTLNAKVISTIDSHSDQWRRIVKEISFESQSIEISREEHYRCFFYQNSSNKQSESSFNRRNFRVFRRFETLLSDKTGGEMASNEDRDLVEFTIKSNMSGSEAIRRFKRSLQIVDLKVKKRKEKTSNKFSFSDEKNQLELITGAQNQTMRIHVHDERGAKLFELDDDNRTLGSYEIHSKMILQVEETNLKRAHMFDDTGDVPKYELTDEEYQTRKNTARHFLQQNKMGKYNPAAQEEHARKEKEKEQQEQLAASKINVNDRFVANFHLNFRLESFV